MLYLIILMYIIAILLFFCKLKSKIYYKILWILMAIPMIVFDHVEQLKGFYLDTIRIYKEMDIFRISEWDDITIYSEAPLSKLYLYLVSMLDINQLLPIINCLLVYGLILYGVNRLGNKLLISNRLKSLALLYIIMFSNYINIYSNIRQPLALAICFIIFILDFYEHKNKIFCFLGYFLASMIHPSLLIMFVLRILILFSLKKVLPVLIILSIIISNYMENIIALFMTYNNDFIVGLAMKQEAYTTIEIMTYTNGARVAVISVDLVAIFISLLLIRFLSKRIYLINKPLINLIVILSVYGFSCMVVDSQFSHRVEPFILYLFSIYFFIIGEKTNFKLSKVGYSNLKIVFGLSFIVLSLYFLYFNVYEEWLAYGF